MTDKEKVLAVHDCECVRWSKKDLSGYEYQITSAGLIFGKMEVYSDMCVSEDDAWSQAASRLSSPADIPERPTRCSLCGADKMDHYDQVQCPLGNDTFSATQRFTPIPDRPLPRAKDSVLQRFPKAYAYHRTGQISGNSPFDFWEIEAGLGEVGLWESSTLGSSAGSIEAEAWENAESRTRNRRANSLSSPGPLPRVEKEIDVATLERETCEALGLTIVEEAPQRVEDSYFMHCEIRGSAYVLNLRMHEGKFQFQVLREAIAEPIQTAPAPQDDTSYEDWLIQQWPDEDDRRHESHVHGYKMRLAWDAARRGSSDNGGSTSNDTPYVPGKRIESSPAPVKEQVCPLCFEDMEPEHVCDLRDSPERIAQLVAEAAPVKEPELSEFTEEDKNIADAYGTGQETGYADGYGDALAGNKPLYTPTPAEKLPINPIEPGQAAIDNQLPCPATVSRNYVMGQAATPADKEMPFDPESVKRHIYDYRLIDDAPKFPVSEYVLASDYEQLLTLYRAPTPEAGSQPKTGHRTWAEVKSGIQLKQALRLLKEMRDIHHVKGGFKMSCSWCDKVDSLLLSPARPEEEK